MALQTERPEAFYLKKHQPLSLVDQTHLWGDSITAIIGPGDALKGKKRKGQPRHVVGWHLQVGGCAWPYAPADGGGG